MAPHIDLEHLLLGAAVALVGCGNGDAHERPRAPTLLDAPLSLLPELLSETGVYDRGSDLLSPLALGSGFAYEPAYPLWSDGGTKRRAVVLPRGTSIDGSDRSEYVFPTGTLIFKSFSFRTPASPDREVPVETRLLRLSETGWEYAVYAWNDDASDAERLDLRRSQARDVLSGGDEIVAHSIPSRLECQQCHESSASTVLGITELQLAPTGSLSSALPWLSPEPSRPFAELPEPESPDAPVLGYLVGNCVHCHNGSNGAASSFDLRPDVALQNLIEVPTASSATAAGIRVTPGDPEASVLFLAMRGSEDREIKDMPPLGVALRDARGLALFEDWIRTLPSRAEP